MKKTTMIDAKFSSFDGKFNEWNHIRLKCNNNIVALYINGKSAGQKIVSKGIPVLSSEVKFGYLGSYPTDIWIKNIQIK